MRDLFFDSKNSFDYYLRRRFGPSRRGYSESGISLTKVLNRLPAYETRTVVKLVEKYRFEPYLRRLSHASVLDNVLHLVLLDRLFNYFTGAESRILDVGSKNFAYGPAIYSFFSHLNGTRSVVGDNGEGKPHLTGVEVDGKRLYLNLFTRQTCAKYYASLVPSAEYIVADFLTHNFDGTFDAICNFFPFMDQEALLDWGLPLRFFKPLDMIKRSYDLLVPGGKLFVAHTTMEEYSHARSLIEASGFVWLIDDALKYSFTSKMLYVSLYQKSCHTS